MINLRRCLAVLHDAIDGNRKVESTMLSCWNAQRDRWSMLCWFIRNSLIVGINCQCLLLAISASIRILGFQRCISSMPLTNVGDHWLCGCCSRRFIGHLRSGVGHNSGTNYRMHGANLMGRLELILVGITPNCSLDMLRYTMARMEFRRRRMGGRRRCGYRCCWRRLFTFQAQNCWGLQLLIVLLDIEIVLDAQVRLLSATNRWIDVLTGRVIKSKLWLRSNNRYLLLIVLIVGEIVLLGNNRWLHANELLLLLRVAITAISDWRLCTGFGNRTVRHRRRIIETILQIYRRLDASSELLLIVLLWSVIVVRTRIDGIDLPIEIQWRWVARIAGIVVVRLLRLIPIIRIKVLRQRCRRRGQRSTEQKKGNLQTERKFDWNSNKWSWILYIY